MAPKDDTIRRQSPPRGPVHFTPLRTSLGGPASALTSFHPIRHVAQRLESGQPPNAPKNYRELSPDSIFPHGAWSAGSFHNPPYDTGSPDSDPPVREQEEISQGQRANVGPEETRINPLPVNHTKANEQVIKSLDQHLQSMIRYYCSDSVDAQIRFLALILEHNGKICRLKRKKQTGSSGVESLACLLCPPTPDHKTVPFKNVNAVRLFAEHVTHDHLHIANPWACFATTCPKVFPYSQDRDRHEKQIHKMYRPKAYEALLKTLAAEQSGRSPISTDDAQSPIGYIGASEVNSPQTTSPAIHPAVPAPSRRNKGGPSSPKSKTPSSSPRVKHYMRDHRSSRGGHRAIREPPLYDNYPGQPGSGPHTFPPAAPSHHDFDMTQARLDGRTEDYRRNRGIQNRVLDERHRAPLMLPPGSNILFHSPLINPTTASVIGYQGPSTNLQPVMQHGTRTSVRLPREHPQLGQANYGPMYNGMQNNMPLLNPQAQHQHDSYAIPGLAQPQPFTEYGVPTVQQQQPQLQHGTFPYGGFQRNAPTPGVQGGITAMPFMTPYPVQVPGPAASSYTHYYTPITQPHGTNAGGFNAQMNHRLSRPSPSNDASNTSHYHTNSTTGTFQYNPSFYSTNNFGPPW